PCGLSTAAPEPSIAQRGSVKLLIPRGACGRLRGRKNIQIPRGRSDRVLMTMPPWSPRYHSAPWTPGSASLSLPDKRKPGRPGEAAFRRWLTKAEPHREAIAAVAALVMHGAGKAAHQMDAEIADLCLRERSRNGWPRNPG